MRPHISKLPESQPRQGFFEDSMYLAVREHLPQTHQGFLDFAYLTGWRKSEIGGLLWTDVDREAETIRLRPELSKNRQARTLKLAGTLTDIIAAQWDARTFISPDDEEMTSRFVFHVKGHRIADWRKRWATACKNAGIPTRIGKAGNELPGRMIHDLRRTAVRNLTRAGTPEVVAMAITGHKTRSVFDRYNIVSVEDIAQAMVRAADYMDVVRTKPNVTEMRKAGKGRA